MSMHQTITIYGQAKTFRLKMGDRAADSVHERGGNSDLAMVSCEAVQQLALA